MSSAEEAIAATMSIRGRGRGQGTTRGPQGKCSGCGSSLHRWKDPDCPAIGKACGKCGALDHFKAQCRSTRQANRGAPRGRGGKAKVGATLDGLEVKQANYDGKDLIFETFHVSDGEVYYPLKFQVDTGALALSLLIQSLLKEA